MSGNITLHCTGSLSQIALPAGSVTQGALAAGAVGRQQMEQTALAEFNLPLESWRVHDSGAALSTTAAADDLGISAGSFGTAANSLQTIDFKASSVTAYARRVVELPLSYDAGQTLEILLSGAMNTTIADGYCWVDVEAHKIAASGSVGADICTTAGSSADTSINSLTSSDHSFTINASGLTAGSLIDIRVTVTGTDTATGTATIGEITRAKLRCDCRG